jgi:adenine-specific DNA methylase
MRYLGNKQKLLDFIRSAIEEDCGDLKDKSFYDLFCGSSTVAKYFRPLTKKVVTNDLE